MSDRKLTIRDGYLHLAGEQPTWNESRYVDFYDAQSSVGGWLRIGMRPNEGHAEMSVCAFLPDGRTAFHYERAPIGGTAWPPAGSLG